MIARLTRADFSFRKRFYLSSGIGAVLVTALLLYLGANPYRAPHCDCNARRVADAMTNGKVTIIDAGLRSPFTVVIAGPTGSGKTELLFRLVKNASEVATPPPVEIIYCYRVWQDKYREIESLVTFHEGDIDVTREIPGDGRNRWLILDDLMGEASGKDETNKLYTKYSHHMNISVFFIVQNLFVKVNRTLSLNSHHFFLFKNLRDGTSVGHLARQAFPNNSKGVMEFYRRATSKPYSYMLMNLRQDANGRARLLSGYLNEGGGIMYSYSTQP